MKRETMDISTPPGWVKEERSEGLRPVHSLAV